MPDHFIHLSENNEHTIVSSYTDNTNYDMHYGAQYDPYSDTHSDTQSDTHSDAISPYQNDSTNSTTYSDIDRPFFYTLACGFVLVGISSIVYRLITRCKSQFNNCKQSIDNVQSYIETSEIEEERDSSDVCSICIESYQSREMTLTLPCNHKYHSTCILSWLENDLSCPMCRRSIHTA